MSAKRIFLAGLTAATLGGCSGLAVGPERVFTVDGQVAQFRSNDPPIVAPLPPLGDDDGLKLFVTQRMFMIDLEYSQYFAKLTNDYQSGSLSGDLALLGLTFASTVVPAASTKTVLSAASTAVAGAKTSIDQDVLLSHTIQILQSTMESNRANIHDRILTNLNKCLHHAYTPWLALSDLEDYYRAGTIPGALESLAAATGNNAQQTKDKKNGQTQNGSNFRLVRRLTAVTLDATPQCTVPGGT